MRSAFSRPPFQAYQSESPVQGIFNRKLGLVIAPCNLAERETLHLVKRNPLEVI